MARVGIDCDGVGFNFGDSVKATLDYFDLGHLWKSGPNPKPYWEFYKDWGWTGEQFKKLCDDGANLGIIFSGPVREGYVEMIEDIARMGHEIIIITDRSFGSTPAVSEELTCEWLAQHGIEYDELIFSADKTCVPTDFFIDDKVENFISLRNAGTEAYLLNRPWNEHFGESIFRLDSLAEFTAIIAEATRQDLSNII